MAGGFSRESEFIRSRSATLELRDGSKVLLRPIVPEDKQLIAEGFKRLSPQSRYRRFFNPVGELSPNQLTYLTEIDYDDHFAWGAIWLDDPDLPGVGVARYVRMKDRPDVAEAAIAVADDFQSRGLGTILLEGLAAFALERGIKRFDSYVLADNRPALGLLKELGAEAEPVESGVVRVEVDLPSMVEEIKEVAIYRVLRAAARGETKHIPRNLFTQ